MEQQLEEIREQQKASWNKFSPGWKKWDDLTMDFLKPMGDEIIRLIKPKNNEVILDVAGGTGEPGLTIASMLKDGKVSSIKVTIPEGLQTKQIISILTKNLNLDSLTLTGLIHDSYF